MTDLDSVVFYTRHHNIRWCNPSTNIKTYKTISAISFTSLLKADETLQSWHSNNSLIFCHLFHISFIFIAAAATKCLNSLPVLCHDEENNLRGWFLRPPDRGGLLDSDAGGVHFERVADGEHHRQRHPSPGEQSHFNG